MISGKSILVAVLLILVGVGAFWAGANYDGGVVRSAHPSAAKNKGDQAAAMDAGEKKIKYWVAPMDSNFRRDKPGKSPMGMDLVPVYDEPEANGADVVVSSAIQQSLGVRTAIVKKGEFKQTIKAVGQTEWNEASTLMLHARSEGWLETFGIDSVGDRVKKGDVLFEVFSPLLVTAQDEYLIAQRSGNRGLLRASENRLLSLGVTKSQVESLRRSGKVLQRLPHRATRDGVVTDLLVRAGMYVRPDTNIATLVNDELLWLSVDVFESDAALIKLGKPATIWFEVLPGEQFSGVVNYIYPQLDTSTRTLKVRIELPNKDRRLKAHMFARVELQSDRREVLQVPREAVIRSAAGSRVITTAGNGRFSVAVVETGRANNLHIEILSGLSHGDRVVTSGQFLLDAEANGEQAMARLTAEKSVVPAVGVIDELLADNKLTITHEPVAELGWPSMTMDFVTAPELKIAASLVGKPIQFSMKKNADGMWELVSYQLANHRSNLAKAPAKADHTNHHSMSDNSAELTQAKVIQFDAAKRRIKLDHEPIQALGMSAMTMTFKVDNDLPLESINIGDAVRFRVEMKPGKGMVITQIEKSK